MSLVEPDQLPAISSTENDTFDWYSHDFEFYDHQIKPTNLNINLEQQMSKLVLRFNYLLLTISTIIRLMMLATDHNQLIINGFDFNKVIEFIIKMSLIMVVLHILYTTLHYLAVKFNFQSLFENHGGRIRIFFFLIWFMFMNVEESKVFKNNLRTNAFLKKTKKSGIVTLLILIVSDIIIEKCSNVFIKNTLSTKIYLTEKTESILRKLTQKQSGLITESSSSSKGNKSCFKSTCINILCNKSDNDNYEDGNTSFFGTVKIKPPAILTVNDAISLAKDLFLKITNDGDLMDFKQFRSMFYHEHDAITAFNYFDSSQNRKIEKKEFRDTILQMYKQRESLEDSIKSTNGFITIVSRMMYVIVSIVIIILYLVMFGVEMSQIAAVLLSSALAFNFFIGETFKIFIKNLMVLLSHQFDLGDEVILNGKDLKVVKIGLMYTSFTDNSGGRIKLGNDELWKQSIVNMTKAYENILCFTMELSSDITPYKINLMKKRIDQFVAQRFFDYTLPSKTINQRSSNCGIDRLFCAVILHCKGYKTPSKKFILRVEFTSYLKQVLSDLNIEVK
ncbi:hypothetical protein NUSPORA_01464 [Nucleospora cyclopteri]